LIAEKGAKIVIFRRFCENRPAGGWLGRVVSFKTIWWVVFEFLRV
jgi:hypothetical protein